MKKAPRETLLAVVRRNQNFRPAADPLLGGAGRPKFNQLEMVTTFTNKTSLVRINARNFELSNTQTHRQDRLQYTAPLSVARSVMNHIARSVLTRYVTSFRMQTAISGHVTATAT